MPSNDKQLAFSVKKAASRKLPNNGANIISMSQGTSPLTKDKVPAADPGKTVGTKRLQTDAPSSPGYHNVYVRRKVEPEHSKLNSHELKGNGRDKTKEQESQQNDVQHDHINKLEVASPIIESGGPVSSESPEKPNTDVVPEKIEPPIASGTSSAQDDTHSSSNQYWKERFDRLQTYLENCDRSTQEGYMRKLRSFPAAGRSMHAIELEKRAIHLLMEEGKELQRMKALNPLGKVFSNSSSKQIPMQQQYQK